MMRWPTISVSDQPVSSSHARLNRSIRPSALATTTSVAAVWRTASRNLNDASSSSTVRSARLVWSINAQCSTETPWTADNLASRSSSPKGFRT
jgi:hypothetical protein